VSVPRIPPQTFRRSYVLFGRLSSLFQHPARATVPQNAVWLSFDDGFKELIDNIFPITHRLNIPITLFVPSGVIEGNGLFPWLHNEPESDGNMVAPDLLAPRDAMTADDLKVLATHPEITIGSHTVNHSVMTCLTDETARFELSESKRKLECLTGRSVKCFSYPEGHFDGREHPLLEEFGYRLATTTVPEFVTSETNPLLVPRFHVGDQIPFAEAVCNMTGVWRPVIDPLRALLGLFVTFKDWLTIRMHSRLHKPRNIYLAPFQFASNHNPRSFHGLGTFFSLLVRAGFILNPNNSKRRGSRQLCR
jgi:peptidoglycan/xylan/chitin deacetylase (PgdA/CDA1 family)